MTTPAAEPGNTNPPSTPSNTPPEGTPPEGEGTPPEGTPPAEGEGEPSGAPETYQPFEIDKAFEISEAQHGEISEFFKSQNFTQDQGQANVKHFEKTLQGMADAAFQQEKTQREGWAATSKADKEVGGDAFEENLAIANKTINAIGDPAMKDGNPVLDDKGKPMTTFGVFLKESGLGNHPEMVRFALRVGKALSPDSLDGAGGGGAPVVEKTGAEVLFPEQGKK